MDLDETLARLEAAKGDPDAMALVTVGFVLESYSPAFKMALEAASIPHWFDESVLRTLLGENLPDETDWFGNLLEFTVVEEFRTHRAWNVHEVTRLALRDRLARKEPERFRELGTRAASFFSGEDNAQKIERVYHLLTAEPDDGALEVRKLWRRWYGTGALEPLQALGKALEELCNRDLLEPRSRAYAQAALLTIQEDRVDLNAREAMARETVNLNTQLGDVVGLIDAFLGLGNVLAAKGQLTEALSAYEQARQSFDQWDRPDSGPEGLDELADIHGYVGRAQQNRGERERALAEFEAALNVRRKLNELDPQDIERRRQLAVAHADLGDALGPTARSSEAETHFTTSLAILEELATELSGQGRTSAAIASLHVRMGAILFSRGGLESGESLEHMKKADEIFQQLLSVDPTNFSLQAGLAGVHRLLASFYLYIENQPEQSEERLAAAQKILNELVEVDPANLRWKDDLANLRHEFGQLREKQKRYAEAVKEYMAAEELLTEHKRSHPDSVDLLLSLAYVQASLGKMILKAAPALDTKDSLTLLLRMFTTLKECRDTRSALLERDPKNARWKELLAQREQELAAACELLAEQIDKGLEIEAEIEITADGLRAAALQGYATSAKLYSELRANEPENTTYMWNISTPLFKGASLLEAMEAADEALIVYRRAENVLHTLTQLKPTSTGYAERLRSVKEAITRLENE